MTNTLAYTIPTIGATPDPTWESYLNAALAAIQTHSHDGVSAGAKILPAGVDLSAGGFNFLNQPQTNASYYDLAQQSSAPAQTAGRGRLYCDTSGNLYYISPSANVLLASTSAISYSSAAKGFIGDYGGTGGACYFNTASVSWPNSSTFFFYTSTSTPSNDNGSRAGLAAGFLSLKSSVNNALIRTVDSAAVTTEDFRFGYNGASASRGEYGLQIYPDSTATGSVVAGNAFSLRETANSATLTPAAGVPTLARAYQLCVGDAVSLGAIANRAFALRNTTVNLSTSTAYPLGYYYAVPTDLTGAATTPATGYGIQWEWRLPSSVSLNTTTASVVAAYQECTWANYAAARGRFAYYVKGSATPTLEMLINSAGGINIGIGSAAPVYASTGLTIGPATSFAAAATVNGLLTAAAGFVGVTSFVFGTNGVGSTLTLNANITTSLNSDWCPKDTGGAAQGASLGTGAKRWKSIFVGDGTATTSGATFGAAYLASANFTPTSYLDLTVRHRDNNIIAYGNFDNTGALVGSGWNVTAATNLAAGHWTVPYYKSIGGGAAVIVTCNGVSGVTTSAGTNNGSSADVWTGDNAGTPTNYAFSIIVVGPPGGTP